ncbi:MAG: glycosyltransferase [Lachnospiraceae bacterium]
MKNKKIKLKNHSSTTSKAKKQTFFYIYVFFTILYLLWRLFKTIPFEYGVVSIIAGMSLFVVEFLGFFEALIHYAHLRDIKTYELPVIPQESYPHVDVFIATYNEDEELLFKTINGCLHMDYPDKSKVHIYLCDDNRRPSMRALAKKMGIEYFDRPNNVGAKAGNLNNAMAQTNSPYIVTLDADMIPQSKFLLETIPYFIGQEIKNQGKEEKEHIHIGFVQTPQSFYNPDLFQFNLFSEARIPNEQDYFYKDIQVSRNKSNSVIYGGSNTVISRQAIVDIGGFYTGSITEDYATGMLIQRKGYICIAIDKVLASGLSPTDLQSLIDQRIRWARGVISTNRKMGVWFAKDMTLSQKLSYWASMQYWYSPFKRLIYFLSPILFSVFGYMVLKCTLGEVLLFWLPMYVSSNIVLSKLSANLRTTKWTGIYETVLFPFLLFPVLLETFCITMKKFKVTDKSKAKSKSKFNGNVVFLLPFAILSVLSLIGSINCIRMMLESGTIGPVIVLFWLLYNLFTLLMCVFFILGRNILRKTERASVMADCTIITKNEIYQCKTNDLSETGISLIMDKPIFIDPDELITLKIKSDRYCVQIKGKVVHVSDRYKDWKYAFSIIEFLDSYEEYLQMLYDRVPTLPQNIDHSSGSFDDLRINISKRVVKNFFLGRALPRVKPKNHIKDTEGNEWELLDFNFLFVSVKNTEVAKEKLSLILDEKLNVVLECTIVNRNAEGKYLYQVNNMKEIDADKNKRIFIHEWTALSWSNLFGEESTVV